MKSIHIRQIDDDILDALKRRARRHRRSLQKEIESLLADASRMTPPDDTEPATPLDSLHSVATGRRAMTWSRESYYDEDGR
jgi:plasmid stability protein